MIEFACIVFISLQKCHDLILKHLHFHLAFVKNKTFKTSYLFLKPIFDIDLESCYHEYKMPSTIATIRFRCEQYHIRNKYDISMQNNS